MSNRNLRTSDRDGPGPPSNELLCTVIDPPNAPRECTLFPAVVARDAVTTTWITAREGAFVSLERAR